MSTMQVLLIIMLAPLALCFGCLLVRIWPVVLGSFFVCAVACGCFLHSAIQDAQKSNAAFETRRDAIIRAHPGITQDELDLRLDFPNNYPEDAAINGRLTYSHPGSNLSDQAHAAMEALKNR